MSIGQIRTLKHDLRTPINHIMGYSELLVEEATDLGDSPSAAHFSTIDKTGETLLKVLDQSLPSSADWSTEHFADLQTHARPLVETIIALSSPGKCPADYAEILDKINQAANNFLGRIEQLHLATA